MRFLRDLLYLTLAVALLGFMARGVTTPVAPAVGSGEYASLKACTPHSDVRIGNDLMDIAVKATANHNQLSDADLGTLMAMAHCLNPEGKPL